MPAALFSFIFLFQKKNKQTKAFFFHKNIMRHLFVNVKHKMLIHVL